MCTMYPFVFREPEVMKGLDWLHEECILVSADKACYITILTLFVRFIITTVSQTNLVLIHHLVIQLILQLPFRKATFFKITFRF